MRATLADRFEANAALEIEGIEGHHHQTRKPLSAVLRVPPPRLQVAISAFNGLFETLRAPFGHPRLTGTLSHTLCGVVTKSVENQQAFGPQSHGGRSSDGWLNSGWNAALQRP